MPQYRFIYDPVRHPGQPPSTWTSGSDTVGRLAAVGTNLIEAKETVTNMFVAEVHFEVAAADANISCSVRLNGATAVPIQGVAFMADASGTTPIESTNGGVRWLPHAGYTELIGFVPDRPPAAQYREHFWSFLGPLPGLKLAVRVKKLG